MLDAQPIDIKWHTGLPVYASENFLKVVGDEYGWLGGFDGSRQLRCILPYTFVRKPGFRFIRFRVETISTQEPISEAEEKSFLNSAVKHFRGIGADVILPASNNAIFRTIPDGAVAAPYGTFIKNLEQPEEALLGEVAADYRKNFRKAEKAGVQIECGPQYLDAAYDLIAGTLQRSKVSFKNRDEFKRQIESGLGENVKIFVAKHENKIQACMVSPFSQHSGFSWYSGTIEEPVKGAMHLLQWQVIRQLRELGVKRFNFTGVRIDPEKGSRQEGIMNFKMRFGGTLVRGYMWKYPLRRLKFASYCLAMRLLRGGDIVDQEGHKLSRG